MALRGETGPVLTLANVATTQIAPGIATLPVNAVVTAGQTATLNLAVTRIPGANHTFGASPAWFNSTNFPNRFHHITSP